MPKTSPDYVKAVEGGVHPTQVNMHYTRINKRTIDHRRCMICYPNITFSFKLFFLFLFPFSLPRVLDGKLAIFIMRLELYRRHFSRGYNVSSVQEKWIYLLRGNVFSFFFFSWSSLLISHTSLKTSKLASFAHSFIHSYRNFLLHPPSFSSYVSLRKEPKRKKFIRVIHSYRNFLLYLWTSWKYHAYIRLNNKRVIVIWK